VVGLVALEAGAAADLTGAGRRADFDAVGVVDAAGAAAPLDEPAELEPDELDDGALAAGEDWSPLEDWPLEDWPLEDWPLEDWPPEDWLLEGAVDWLELPVPEPEVDADWLVDAGTWVTVGAELLTVWVSVLTTDPTVLVTGSVTD
jgi:hypothetical protein